MDWRVTMGLFGRWFGGHDRKSGDDPMAVTRPARAASEGGSAAISGGAPPTEARAEDGSQTVREKIQYLLDTAINPAVAGHGGRVSLIDVKGNVVYLQMGGGCQGCGQADVTLKQGVERMIREEVPEVLEILDVTDHAGGRNPYYAPSKQ